MGVQGRQEVREERRKQLRVLFVTDKNTRSLFAPHSFVEKSGMRLRR